MSDNKKFRIQNGVDVTGELSINDVVVIDANGKVVPEAISEAISGSTSSDIAALQAQVSAILGTSPETLDTLQEIVASFQDADSNIVTTVSTNTTAIADMQPQVSTNTAAIAAANARTSGISTSSGSSNIQMSAEVDMDGNKVTNMGEPTDGSDAATKDYVDVKSQLAITTGATDKAELLAAIAAETNRATVVESTLQTNIDSLSDDKDSDIAQEITNRTTADALLQAQIDAEESARTIQDASLDSKITSEATRAVAAELGLQQSINDITSGTSEFTGDLIPNQDNVHSLGSETKMWKDVYIGPGSLYINGQKVIEDNSGTITVNADPGQNLSLNTSGGGAIDLNSGDESVQIRSDLVISSSKTISTTGGAPTKFGGDVDMQGNTLGNVAEPVNDNDAVTKAWFESYVATPHTGSKTFVDDVVIQGNLTVSGSTITVNSETMSVADNMVDLNSNMTSGTPTENAGIRVMRGDQLPKTFLWNEANDQWTAEGPLKADSFVGDGSGLSGMYGDADVTALVDSDYIQSRQSSSNSLSMGDGEIATFGDSNDLQIYHDGIHSYVQDTNAGNLYLKSNGAEITLRDGSNTSMIRAFTGGGVRLFNNGTERLEVTSTGIDVTGSVEADGGNFTGQVQFNGTAGIQLDDGAQAHTWTLDDNFTSRLNIGTASSSATWKIGSNNNAYLTVSPSGIDVTGTATMDGLTVGDTSVSQSLFQMLANPTNGANTIHFGDGASADAYVGYINYAHDSNSMQFAANGTERMRIDASGNVGIGESSPSVPLHIKGSGTYIAGVESTSAYAYLGLRDSNSGGSMSDPTVGVGAQTNNLAFRAGGAERMRISNLGKVGIGTSSPLTILEIEDLQSQLTIDSTASSFSRVVHQHNGTSMWTTGTRSASDYHIYRESGSGNVIIDQGNVGIGTDSPDSNIAIGIDFNSFVVGRYNLGSGLPSSLGGVFSAFSNDGSFNSGDLVLQSRAGVNNRSIIFYTGNTTTERMRIDANGNVGIGTSAPVEPLHVREANDGGTARVALFENAATLAGSQAEILLVSGGNTDRGVAVSSYNESASGQPASMIFSTSAAYAAPTERMRIDSSGNVGIGVTPSAWRTIFADKALDLGTHSALYDQFGGSTFLTNNFYRSNDNSFKYKTTGGATGISLDSGSLSFLNAPSGTAGTTATITETMRIDSSGNVGIGTNSNFGKLSINSNGAPATSGNMTTGLTVHNGPVGTAINIGTNDGGSYNYIQSAYVNSTGTARNLAFFVGAARAVDIDTSGNLLVGKTSSDTNVEGSVLFADSSSGAAGAFTSDGIRALLVNRKSSDGTIIDVRKDGTTVGRIGSYSGVVSYLVLDPRANGSGLIGLTNEIAPTNELGNPSDAGKDLGSSGRRFKDIYLSGGAYLGGTGSANKLDDYEEGTWTPAVQGSGGGTYTHSGITARYTKIGNLVTIDCQLVNITISGSGHTGYLSIAGAPFAKRGDHFPQGPVALSSVDFSNNMNYATVEFITTGSTSVLYIRQHGDNFAGADLPVSAINSGASDIQFTIQYMTD